MPREIWFGVVGCPPAEAAFFIHRFLRHPSFGTNAKRMGCVVRVHHDGIHFWQLRWTTLQSKAWPAD